MLFSAQSINQGEGGGGSKHQLDQTTLPEKLSFLLWGFQGHIAYKVQYLYEVISETQFYITKIICHDKNTSIHDVFPFFSPPPPFSHFSLCFAMKYIIIIEMGVSLGDKVIIQKMRCRNNLYIMVHTCKN